MRQTANPKIFTNNVQVGGLDTRWMAALPVKPSLSVGRASVPVKSS